MHQDERPLHTSPGSDLAHPSLVDRFSDAVIFVDKTATILAANERAGAIVGTDPHMLPGRSFWQAAPHLITTTFYQAVVHAIRIHTSFQVVYRSPITQTW